MFLYIRLLLLLVTVVPVDNLYIVILFNIVG